MPPVTILFVRTAFLYLVIGLFTGAVMDISYGSGNPVLSGLLLSEYVHMLTVGWLTQLIFGVSYWMFPQAKDKEGFINLEKVAFAVYACLNAGLIIRIFIEPFIRLGIFENLYFLVVIAAVLQFLTAVGFTIITWPRIRGRQSA
ncbi:MAG: hypothetical protein K8F91_07685 [Candidatus Obscuribacterales bacterium]|nr:hypothetical protein [Candidatus Obscuribacterales bacterium]